MHIYYKNPSKHTIDIIKFFNHNFFIKIELFDLFLIIQKKNNTSSKINFKVAENVYKILLSKIYFILFLKYPKSEVKKF